MKYLATIFLALSVLFGFLAYYYNQRANSYCELWKNSEANNDVLIKARRKDYEDKLEISRKNKELEKEAKNDKSTFDWNFPIGNSPVILRLQSSN